jgi:hypothetical protein
VAQDVGGDVLGGALAAGGVHVPEDADPGRVQRGDRGLVRAIGFSAGAVGRVDDDGVQPVGETGEPVPGAGVLCGVDVQR